MCSAYVTAYVWGIWFHFIILLPISAYSLLPFPTRLSCFVALVCSMRSQPARTQTTQLILSFSRLSLSAYRYAFSVASSPQCTVTDSLIRTGSFSFELASNVSGLRNVCLIELGAILFLKIYFALRSLSIAIDGIFCCSYWIGLPQDSIYFCFRCFYFFFIAVTVYLWIIFGNRDFVLLFV